MIILGLGSNVGNRLTHLRTAIKHLSALTELKILKTSPVYESDALMPPSENPETLDRFSKDYIWDQDFLNMAVAIATDLPPEALIIKLKDIEKTMDRQTKQRWYPRTIDIDILAWEDRIIQTEKMTVPHKGLPERPFALWPLYDLAPEWIHPQLNQSVKTLVSAFGDKFSGRAPLHTRQILADVTETQLVGIINATPDSFSEQGACFALEDAVAQAKRHFAEGASILDIGVESTNPRSTPITAKEEWERLEPLLTAIQSDLPEAKLSIDTYHPETAEKVLAFNIAYLNDVSGFQNPKMRQVAKAANLPIIFMHSLCVPTRKEVLIPADQNPVTVIFDWATDRINTFLSEGFALENLIFDPGIGFGNAAEQAMILLKHIDHFHKLGVKLYVGHSRKSFLNLITDKPFSDRDFETSLVTTHLARKHVHFLRVHNVADNQQALKLQDYLH